MCYFIDRFTLEPHFIQGEKGDAQPWNYLPNAATPQAEAARAAGIYPYFHELESRQAPEVVMEGKRRIMLGSNNYLGLTTHPRVIQAGRDALEAFGSGCSGSRFLNGTLCLHVELEKELADF